MLLESLERARQAVRQAQSLYCTPSGKALDQALPLWEGIESTLRTLLVQPGELDAGRRRRAREQVRMLRDELSRARLLLEQANAFHEGWVHYKALLQGGYDSGGAPAGPPVAGRTLAEG